VVFGGGEFLAALRPKSNAAQTKATKKKSA
jgi:hypothetical protein